MNDERGTRFLIGDASNAFSLGTPPIPSPENKEKIFNWLRGVTWLLDESDALPAYKAERAHGMIKECETLLDEITDFHPKTILVQEGKQSKKSKEKLGETMNILCSLVALSLQEKPVEIRHSKKRFSLAYDSDNRTFSFNKKSYRIRSNTHFAKLCEVFYSNCPKSGRMEWERLANILREKYPEIGTIDREKIRTTIKDLHRWATTKNYDDLLPIIELSDQEIVRKK